MSDILDTLSGITELKVRGTVCHSLPLSRDHERVCVEASLSPSNFVVSIAVSPQRCRCSRPLCTPESTAVSLLLCASSLPVSSILQQSLGLHANRKLFEARAVSLMKHVFYEANKKKGWFWSRSRSHLCKRPKSEHL